MNVLFGQNGFISGILLGGGLLLLDRLPILAGCLFGLLCYKPPLAALVLVALMFGRYWETLIATLVTLLAASLSSIMVFGYQVWVAYFQVQSIPMQLLEMGAANWSIMPTCFATMLSAGSGVKTAYLVQGAVMLAVLAAVAWAWRQRLSLANRGAVLVLGTLLFTPYAFVYDLALLALPLGWLWEEGRQRGRWPGELLLLWFGWLMPYAALYLWNEINVFNGKLQLAPIVLLMLFLLSLVKAKIALKQASADPQNHPSSASPS
ncbi:MAG: glycosyltransferase family 87 protein [Desulfobaccales bacterium]